jgi:hypothetical protein
LRARIAGYSTDVYWPLAWSAGVVVLLAAAGGVVRAAPLRLQTTGPVGDLLADLGPP